MSEEHTQAVEASADAIHKAKNAAAAVETAREAQLAEAIMKSTEQTEAAVIRALSKVFREGDEEDPTQMKVLVRRIPILCTNIQAMHEDIAEIKDGNKWLVRIVVGAVVLAVIKLVILP